MQLSVFALMNFNRTLGLVLLLYLFPIVLICCVIAMFTPIYADCDAWAIGLPMTKSITQRDDKLAEQYDYELVDLKKPPSVKIRISNLRFKFPKFLPNKNNYISAAKLKIHVFGGISCAWKSQ